MADVALGRPPAKPRVALADVEEVHLGPPVPSMLGQLRALRCARICRLVPTSLKRDLLAAFGQLSTKRQRKSARHFPGSFLTPQRTRNNLKDTALSVEFESKVKVGHGV